MPFLSRVTLGQPRTLPPGPSRGGHQQGSQPAARGRTRWQGLGEQGRARSRAPVGDLGRTSHCLPALGPWRTLLTHHSVVPAGLEMESPGTRPVGSSQCGQAAAADRAELARKPNPVCAPGGSRDLPSCEPRPAATSGGGLGGHRDHAKCARVGKAGSSSLPPSLPARPWERTPVEWPHSVFTSV